MILELFVVLLLMSFFIIWVGYKYDDIGFKVVGFFFIFLLSLVLINNSLSYQTGIFKIANVTSPNVTTTTETFTYTNYNDTSSHYFGYFLAVISSFAMIFSFMFPNKGDIRRS